MVVVRAVPVRVAFGAVYLGRTFQRVGLGEELLHRMDQVAYPAGALVALLCGGGGGGGALVLQRVEAISVQWHLFLKLVEEVRWDSVHFSAATVRR